MNPKQLDVSQCRVIAPAFVSFEPYVAKNTTVNLAGNAADMFAMTASLGDANVFLLTRPTSTS